jgi:hypothetical protein
MRFAKDMEAPKPRRTAWWLTRAVGAMAAIGGLSVMLAIGAAAGNAEITVSVFADTIKTDHIEGNTYPYQIAAFTDTAACTAGHACLATDFTARVNWGDNIGIANSGLVGTTGTPGTYTVTASYTYADEFNNGVLCASPPCAYHVHVFVTDNVDGFTNSGDNIASGGIAVDDELFAGPASPNFFSATAGRPFNGAIGSFQDGNRKASALDTNGSTEYHVVISWGDGTTDSINLPVTVLACNPTTSGIGAGQGCIVELNGSHTYAAAQTYTVSGTFDDGSNTLQGFFTSTAYVHAARIAVKPAPAGTPGGRSAVQQSPAGAPGPRIAAGLSSSPTRVATRQTTDASSAQSHGFVPTTDTTAHGIALRSFGRFDAKSLDQAGTLPFGSSTSALATFFNAGAGLFRSAGDKALGA